MGNRFLYYDFNRTRYLKICQYLLICSRDNDNLMPLIRAFRFCHGLCSSIAPLFDWLLVGAVGQGSGAQRARQILADTVACGCCARQRTVHQPSATASTSSCCFCRRWALPVHHDHRQRKCFRSGWTYPSPSCRVERSQGGSFSYTLWSSANYFLVMT